MYILQDSQEVIVCTCYRVTKTLMYVHVIRLTRGYCMYMSQGYQEAIEYTCYRTCKMLVHVYVKGLTRGQYMYMLQDSQGVVHVDVIGFIRDYMYMLKNL